MRLWDRLIAFLRPAVPSVKSEQGAVDMDAIARAHARALKDAAAMRARQRISDAELRAILTLARSRAKR